jgi:hypothetical protein
MSLEQYRERAVGTWSRMLFLSADCSREKASGGVAGRTGRMQVGRGDGKQLLCIQQRKLCKAAKDEKNERNLESKRGQESMAYGQAIGFLTRS